MLLNDVQVEGMERVYISSKLKAQNRLCRIRDGVSHDIRASDYYEKVRPHITIVPPFYVDDEKTDMVHGMLERTDIEGTEVKINNLKIWPNMKELRYIMLDVDVDIRDEQYELTDDLRDAGAEYMKSPVSPHITLLKSNREWEIPPESLVDRVQDTIGTCTDVENTKISEVEVVTGD